MYLYGFVTQSDFDYQPRIIANLIWATADTTYLSFYYDMNLFAVNF